jgi:hypothetical protein
LSLYRQAPSTLTPDVAEALCDLNAIMPKYWIEQVFQQQGLEPHRLPEGTMEIIVANGFKMYDEDLRLSVPFVNTDLTHDQKGI